MNLTYIAYLACYINGQTKSRCAPGQPVCNPASDKSTCHVNHMLTVLNPNELK
jgi:hypothetical protein